MRTKVKICCIANTNEAEIAIAHGADALGLVGPMPSGPGTISLDTAREIANQTPPPISTFLLTAETKANQIAEQVQYVGTDTVQIVNHVEVEELKKLKTLLPNIRRVQVIHVESSSALNLIKEYEPFADAFLLDSGRPLAATPELGGTGRTHDWSISKKIVIDSSRPVFLAGGLNAENVADAVQQVQPYGVDLCSGVRKGYDLHEASLRSFMKSLAASIDTH